MRRRHLFALLASSSALVACGSSPVSRGGDAEGGGGGRVGSGAFERGLASWYGEPHHGRRTASGEVFDMNALTAAHKTLPFGTRLRVLNPSNGREVVVRINDRGPFKEGRVIDLSRAAAERIGLIRAGVAPVLLYRD